MNGLGMYLMFLGSSSARSCSRGAAGSRADPREAQWCCHSSFLPSAGHTLIFTPGLSHKPGGSPSLQDSLHCFYLFVSLTRVSQGHVCWGRDKMPCRGAREGARFSGNLSTFQAALSPATWGESSQLRVLQTAPLHSWGWAELPVQAVWTQFQPCNAGGLS